MHIDGFCFSIQVFRNQSRAGFISNFYASMHTAYPDKYSNNNIKEPDLDVGCGVMFVTVQTQGF